MLCEGHSTKLSTNHFYFLNASAPLPLPLPIQEPIFPYMTQKIVHNKYLIVSDVLAWRNDQKLNVRCYTQGPPY